MSEPNRRVVAADESLPVQVVESPLPNNPNHADVIDWPADKPAQKEIALLSARDAIYRPKPTP